MRLISAGSLVRAQSGPLFRAISQVRCLPSVTNKNRLYARQIRDGVIKHVISFITKVVHMAVTGRILRTGHHFVALRRRTVMRRFEIGKDHKITHSIGRRPRKTLTCTLPSNLRSIRAAWRPRSSRLRSRRASRACRRGSRPAPSPGVARSRSSTSRCCRNPPCR